MARVATLKKQYQKENPNTFLIMAGDFVSPSVYNSLQYEGTRIRGRQMIEAMNAAGTDLAIFGNHEFDISENELQNRINESHFQWVASNTFHKQRDSIFSFAKTDSTGVRPFPKSYIMNLRDKDGTTARVGFIGLTLPFNKADYVSYTDPLTTAKELYGRLQDSCNAIVAVTHQSMADDITLAKELPALTVILGGHEHDMRFDKIGSIYITKAHANARSAFIVKLKIDKKRNKVTVAPELKYLNDSIPFDSSTNAVVQKWGTIAENNYASLSFDPTKVVMATGEPLDGRESQVRSKSTSLTRLVTAAMANACPQADVVIFNAGSIRVDDILQPPVTQYDIIRSMPFGGGIREADMKGSLLLQVLEAGLRNNGVGGYLHYQPVVYTTSSRSWAINNAPLDTNKIYRVAMSEFIFTGKEANLDFLYPGNPGIVKVYDAETSAHSPKSDIRLAVVQYLAK